MTQLTDDQRKAWAKYIDSFEKAAVFKETFLYDLPEGQREIYIGFGQITYNNRIGETSDVPVKRGGLKAVLADLAHIDDFLYDLSRGGDTGETREMCLDEAAGVGREKLWELMGGLRKALGMKPLPSRAGIEAPPFSLGPES
jgi:hypothetical protein